jgi:hypothetical protein
MAVTYTWRITGLKTSSVNGSDNVVVQTYWEKIGRDGSIEGKYVGATPFSSSKIPEGYTFKPFSKLTETEVLEWIKAIVVGPYEQHVNEQIQKHIDEQKSPVVESTLPWEVPVANTK